MVNSGFIISQNDRKCLTAAIWQCVV